MLKWERDMLIDLFKIDNCIKRYKIIQYGFNEYDIIDTSIENFIDNYICVHKSRDDLITEEYADFVNCILNAYIPKLKTYLGESNTDLIINNFRIEDCKLITWTSILECYIKIIGVNSQRIQSYHQNSKYNSIYCVTYEVIKEFAKTLANLIFDINNILSKKIEDHNNHNIELLKKAAINKLLDSFEVGNFIESFRSEALCEKSLNSNHVEFIRNYILMDDIYRLISYRYTYFLNRSISSKRDDVYRFLGEDAYKFISETFKSDNFYGVIKSWDNLIDKYRNIINKCDREIKFIECKRLYSGDPVSPIEDLQYRIAMKLAYSLIIFVNAIKDEVSKYHKSEVSLNMVIDELRRFFNIENCIKYYMPAFLIDYNYSQFIDKYILNGYIKDYDAITRNYAAFVNFCVSSIIDRIRELRSIIEPIDDTNTKFADNVINKLKIFLVWKNSDDDKKTWDNLLNHYAVLVLGRSPYESDRLARFPELICKIFAIQLYNFVYEIRNKSRELKKINKFRQLDFTHGRFSDLEVGYPRSFKTEEGGYCAIVGESELLGIDYSDKPAIAMGAMGMIKGNGITPEEFKNIIEKVGSSPVVDSVNKVIEQEKERREKMIDEIAREFNLQLDRIARLNEFYNKDKILYKPYQIYNNIFGGNNNMNQKAFTIKDIIFSGDRTIALWENGDKTIVRMQDDETVYDPEKAIMALFMKRVYEMYNLPARQKSMNKDLDKYLTKYNEHKDEITAYLAKKNNKTTDDTNKAE